MHEEETDEISSANLKRRSDNANKRDFFLRGGSDASSCVWGLLLCIMKGVTTIREWVTTIREGGNY